MVFMSTKETKEHGHQSLEALLHKVALARAAGQQAEIVIQEIRPNVYRARAFFEAERPSTEGNKS